MRRLLTSFLLASVLALGVFGSAFAHVHGITPLGCLGVAHDGAFQADNTPAAAANGGPITGLIPRDVGRAPLGFGDGGFDTPACPVP